MISVQEKRENPRLEICLGSSIRSQNEETRDYSLVRNISNTGMFISAKREYAQGSITDCLISIDDEVISFKGKIVRCSYESPYNGYGIEIDEIDGMDSEKLNHFIDSRFLEVTRFNFPESDDKNFQESIVTYSDFGRFNKEYDDRLLYDSNYIQTDGKESRLLQANLPFYAVVDNYDFGYQTEETKAQVKDILSFEWISKGRNLLILGPSGAGKTHMAVGLAVKAIEKGYKTSFISMYSLVSMLKSERTVLESKYSLSKIFDSRLVIIDQVGDVILSKQEADMVFQFVKSLYGRTSIIMTSDLTFEQWKRSLGNEGTADLIASNLVHNIWLRGLMN